MDKEKSYKNKQNPALLKRSLARLMAVQILYQKDFNSSNQNLDKIKNDVIENYVLDCGDDISSYKNKIDEKFLENLLSGVSMVETNLDEKIINNLKAGWSLKALEEPILQILRCAIFELNYVKNVPAKVVLDEYVSIAASFFDSKKVTFVNAIIDKIAKDLKS